MSPCGAGRVTTTVHVAGQGFRILRPHDRGGMAMLRAASTAIGFLALAAFATAEARGQFIFAGPGSTPQGDFLRGEGIALWGAGQFNLNTAQANSINTDTWIRFNDYLYFSFKYDREQK